MKLSWAKISLLILGSSAIGAVCLLISSCGSGVHSVVPTLVGISPAYAVAGASTQTVVISGTRFTPSTAVTFNGSPHSSAYVSDQQITILLNQADLAQPGIYTITISNPSLNGAASTSAKFSVWQPLTEPSTGLHFAVPPFETANRTTVDNAVAGQTFINFRLQDGTGTYVPEFSLTLYSNSSSSGLLQWFEQNVDVNGILYTNGSYKQESLSDSSTALVFNGTIPDQFYAVGGGPPLGNAYKILPSGQIVGIAPSQVDDLSDYGYPTQSDISQMELEILGTVHF